jgi:hypothetical protein
MMIRLYRLVSGVSMGPVEINLVCTLPNIIYFSLTMTGFETYASESATTE